MTSQNICSTSLFWALVLYFQLPLMARTSKLATKGVFTPEQLVNATNYTSFPWRRLLNISQHTISCHLNFLVTPQTLHAQNRTNLCSQPSFTALRFSPSLRCRTVHPTQSLHRESLRLFLHHHIHTCLFDHLILSCDFTYSLYAEHFLIYISISDLSADPYI